MSDTVVSLFQYMGHPSQSSVRSTAMDMASQDINNQTVHLSATGKVTMLVIVDPSTGDYYNPAEKIGDDTQVILLSADRDGIEQITESLQSQSAVTGLHVICQSDAGSLQLGSVQLNADNVDAYGWQLQQWAESLGINAEILFYSSNVMDSDRGRALIRQIGLLTGATVKVL